MIVLNIDNKEYKFEEKQLTYANSKVINKKVAKDNLFIMKKVFDKNNLNFYLMYGTLLGAVREKDFISHDIDSDVIIFDEEKLLKCIPQLLKEGLTLVRLEKGSKTYSFMKNECYIDVYVVKNIPGVKGKFYFRIIGKLFPKKFLRSFSRINFLGEEFEIPNNPKKLLKYLYGKTWMTPIKDKPGRDEPKYVIYSKKIIKIFLPKSIITKIKTKNEK